MKSSIKTIWNGCDQLILIESSKNDILLEVVDRISEQFSTTWIKWINISCDKTISFENDKLIWLLTIWHRYPSGQIHINPSLEIKSSSFQIHSLFMVRRH